MAAFDAGCTRTLWPQRHTYALAKGRASPENAFIPLVFLSFTPFLATHLPSCAQLSSRLSFHQVIINHDPHLHLSGFGPLRKILTLNHCLRSPDFQPALPDLPRVTASDSALEISPDPPPESQMQSPKL